MKTELCRLYAKDRDGQTVYESRGLTRSTLYSNDFPESYEIRLTMVPQPILPGHGQADMIVYWEEGPLHKSR